MRYGFRNIFNCCSLLAGAIILMCLLSTVGCRAKKDTSKHESYVMGSERTERRTDSIRVMEIVEERSERNGSKVERLYTRTTEYDIEGAIRRISETWWDRQQGDMASEERTERTLSVEGSETIIAAKGSSTVVKQEKTKIDTDSRPVQGFEWFWVIASVTLILSVVIYLLINKKNKWL